MQQLLNRNYGAEAAQKLKITEAEARYFVFTGDAANTTYNPLDEHIKVLFKDGTCARYFTG